MTHPADATLGDPLYRALISKFTPIKKWRKRRDDKLAISKLNAITEFIKVYGSGNKYYELKDKATSIALEL